MSATWKKDFPFDEVISQVKKKMQNDNSLIISGMKLEIFNLLSCDKNISEIDLCYIIDDSLMACHLNRTLTSDSLLKEINNKISEYLKKQEMEFIVRATLSIDNKNSIDSINLEKAKLEFTREDDSIFAEKTKSIYDQFKDLYGYDYEKKYLPVRIKMKSRSTNSALVEAIDYLDFFRGICNFSLTKNIIYFNHGIKLYPINRVLFGPVITIHQLNGDLVNDSTYIFDPDFYGSVDWLVDNDPDDLQKCLGGFKLANKKIEKHKYRQDLINWFIMYARALDTRDYQSSFLKLSCLLEKLSCCDMSYKKIIARRVSYLFRNPEYHSFILEQLRDFRDKSIHHGATTQIFSSAYLYQLKFYVDRLLDFHLNNEDDFASPQEVANLLDTPKDKELLDMKMKCYEITKKRLIE
jgi:hypothetical protein